MIRSTVLAVFATTFFGLSASAPAQDKKPQKFARYLGEAGKPVYGLVESDNLREIAGDLFSTWKPTEQLTPAAKAKFLPVTDARTVFALAGNYQDHLARLPPERLEK